MGMMWSRLAEGDMIHLNYCDCAWELPWRIGLLEKTWRWALQAPGAGETVAALSGYKEIKQ